MPFRERFDCLWCGQPHATRSADDIEGWAQLCPDCLGRAQDNGFLRSRLRSALGARSKAAGTTASAADSAAAGQAPTGTSVADTPSAADVSSVADRYDDWYLRRGAFSRGPLIDMPWQMELDEVTRWVDEAPLAGVIVELSAGSGWWSTLLAGKGELWIYDVDESALERARERLLAHGLKAHLHARDAMEPPERTVDGVFAAHLLGRATDDSALARRLGIVRRWLRPGGIFVFVESRPGGADAAMIDGPAGPILARPAAALAAAVDDAGLGSSDVTETSTAFVMGRAVSP